MTIGDEITEWFTLIALAGMIRVPLHGRTSQVGLSCVCLSTITMVGSQEDIGINLIFLRRLALFERLY